MKILTVFLLLSLNQFVYSQEESINDNKFILIQRLMTCQSIALQANVEQNLNYKKAYVILGLKNLTYSKKTYDEILNSDFELDEKTIKSITALLELYEVSFLTIKSNPYFSEMETMQMAIGLGMMKNHLKTIITNF